jgi:RNA polymerase sigma-70 factor (ECF subfamily)
MTHPDRRDQYEDDLIAAAQRGSTTAFACLYRHHLARVQRTCRRYLVDRHDIEEAVQETFLRAFRALPRFQGDHLLGAWLVKIATNVCWDLGRKRGRALTLVSLTDDVEIIDEPPASSIVEEGTLVADIFGRMNPTHVLALQLAEVHGMSHAEIGARLGKTPNQVKALLFRARRTFQRLWNGEIIATRSTSW